MIVAAEVNYLKTEEMSRFYNKNFELAFESQRNHFYKTLIINKTISVFLS